MAASITHNQVRSVTGGAYRVVSTITASTGIPTQVFVFETATGAYNRVASASDLFDLPTTQAAAQSAGQGYYRLASVSRDFVLLGEADDFASYVAARLRDLVAAYDVAVTAFVGTTTATYTSP